MTESISDWLGSLGYTINNEQQCFESGRTRIPFANIRGHTLDGFKTLAARAGLIPREGGHHVFPRWGFNTFTAQDETCPCPHEDTPVPPGDAVPKGYFDEKHQVWIIPDDSFTAEELETLRTWAQCPGTIVLGKPYALPPMFPIELIP